MNDEKKKSKKELTNAYKQKQFKVGIYQIRNKINNKIFLESSVNLDAIWNRNHIQLKFGTHQNKELQKDWNEIGPEHFVFEIVSEIQQKEGEQKDYRKEVLQLEAMFMEELQPYDEKGYHKKKLK
jgi:hypothetical protein